mmetsp:Transcript_238/g.403  ORF Transcript_238/g.403 Transcript_238/m.403 type:complete len:241 (-) Transcript_238:86-808(-)
MSRLLTIFLLGNICVSLGYFFGPKANIKAVGLFANPSVYVPVHSRVMRTQATTNVLIAAAKGEKNDDQSATIKAPKKKRVRRQRKEDLASAPKPKPEPVLREIEADPDESNIDSDQWSYSSLGINPAAEERKRRSVEEKLAADLAAFKRTQAPSKKEEDAGAMGQAKDIFSVILTIDFFVVLGMLGWFLVGIAFRYGFQQSFILDSFKASFDTLVQPAIGLLMLGTIAGGVISRKSNDEN